MKSTADTGTPLVLSATGEKTLKTWWQILHRRFRWRSLCWPHSRSIQRLTFKPQNRLCAVVMPPAHCSFCQLHSRWELFSQHSWLQILLKHPILLPQDVNLLQCSSSP